MKKRAARQQPRNAAAIVEARSCGKLEDGDCIIVSFIGDTGLSEPHVYADSGKRYDWRFAEGLHVSMVVRPGVDAAKTMEDLFRSTMPYPTVTDFDRKIVASVVDKPGGGVKLWPRRSGSGPWRALFD